MKQTPQEITALKHRIEKAKQKHKIIKQPSMLRFFTNTAFRATTEFCAPIMVGICLGYTADWWFGTKPMIMIVLGLFGCASGVLNMYNMGKKIERSIEE